MSLHSQSINVVNILGTEYSLKAPEGEEQTLSQAAHMLNVALSETKRKFPTLIGDKLLVLAALNLCSRQIELQREHQRTLEQTQAKVDAAVDAIARTLGEP
ncbi:cell division protein ZapA [Pseudomonas sp. K1(2024)]|uniref:Cell division protein ZapA n=2 Tax=Pseudomonas TaxID=286 RepID=A0AAI8PD93_9PSED|nr:MULTISPECIES: cell division protein ZapA [Pseudomonas]AIZ34569.1 ZapA [Pseudomonas parafulva]AXO90330.1 cell division protein ZapA [Pseudomonas parafulva]MDO7904425.1 cell division protein ZapA [Pseudomonas sp. K13]MDV9032358.1 cell division protein ZapA [Pseudomonas sp. RAC1]